MVDVGHLDAGVLDDLLERRLATVDHTKQALQGKGLGAVQDALAVGVRWIAVDDITPLRARVGDRIGFNGSISKKNKDAPDDEAYRLLDQFLEQGVEIIKFWSAPRGRERGLVVDAPWRIEAVRRAKAAGIRLFMVHVADPDRGMDGLRGDGLLHGQTVAGAGYEPPTARAGSNKLPAPRKRGTASKRPWKAVWPKPTAAAGLCPPS